MASFTVFQSLIDTVQGGLLLVWPDSGHILGANQLAAILLATPHAQLIGQPLHGFLPAGETQIPALLAGHDMVYNRSMQLQTATGRLINVQFSLREVLLDGSRIMVVSFSDRTEQQLMSQLLDFEQQLLARSLKLVKQLHLQHIAGAEDDQLTGLISMPELLAAAHTETGRIRRYGGALSGMAVQMLSLPPAGADAEMAAARRHLLQLAASICVQSTRDSDLVARREEDVFLLLLPGTSLSGADELAPRLLLALSQPAGFAEVQTLPLRLCIGISALRDDEQAPNAMLTRLQGALDQARMAGSNRIFRQA